jgi:RNA polymerase sigma-70 factor (ECF subfamily)
VTNADERFRALFDEHYRNILGYALRRVSDPTDAADIASETFTVAWRRFDDVPAHPESKLWLYGTARLVIRNHKRSSMRRTRLNERLGAVLRTRIPSEDYAFTTARNAIAFAMQSLNDFDREILQLTIWEEFTPTEIATVLDAEPVRVRKRLFHARKHLEQKLSDGHVETKPRTIEIEQGSGT